MTRRPFRMTGLFCADKQSSYVGTEDWELAHEAEGTI